MIEEVEAAWTRSVFEGFLIEEAEGIIRRELALQASYRPSVRVSIEGDELVKTLVIDVMPGPRAERIDLRIEGAGESLRKDLLDAVGDRSHAMQALTNPREFERTVMLALQSLGYQQHPSVSAIPSLKTPPLYSGHGKAGTAVPSWQRGNRAHQQHHPGRTARGGGARGGRTLSSRGPRERTESTAGTISPRGLRRPRSRRARRSVRPTPQ